MDFAQVPKGTMMTTGSELFAVDIGNTRIKIGRYNRQKMVSVKGLPQPEQVLFCETNDLQELDLWLRESPLPAQSQWIVSCVNARNLEMFTHWMEANRPDDTIVLLNNDNIRIPVNVDAPEKVGVDRLCSAVAALRLKDDGEPSLVVDLGTAVTLDIVSGQGIFQGGAIMPGFQAATSALHKMTEALPLIDIDELRQPTFPGKNTVSAIEAGLFWGIIGAIRQFLALAHSESRPALLILTGGNAFQVWEALLNPYTNSKSDTVMCEATRVDDPSGFSLPPDGVHVGTNQSDDPHSVPDNGFIPVHRFHEVICCPYLTLSGIALCGVNDCAVNA